MVFFLLFLSELFVLFLLSHSLTRSISFVTYHFTRSRKITITVLSLLFFPGTVIHELSHAIMAGLLGVPVGTMEFVPRIDGDRVKMGSVQIGQTDFFRRFLIGAAPFFIGVTLLLAILFYAANYDLTQNPWMALLVGYGIFEIGNTMFSSRKDMEGAVELLATVAIIAIIFYFLGVRIPSFNPETLLGNPQLQTALRQGCLFLLFPIILDVLAIGLMKFIKR